MARASPTASSSLASAVRGPAAALRSTGLSTRARIAGTGWSWASLIGIRQPSLRLLFLALEELDRRGWHDRGDGMLVDELGMGVPAQQHGKIVEPGDDPLQLDAADQVD